MNAPVKVIDFPVAAPAPKKSKSPAPFANSALARFNVPGRYRQARGLRMWIRETGGATRKEWYLVLTVDGRDRTKFLGTFPDMDVAAAEAEALRLRSLDDPFGDTPTSDTEAKTFAEAAKAWFDETSRTWCEDHALRTWNSVEVHFGILGKLDVAKVTTADFRRALLHKDFWHKSPEVGDRTLGRFRAIVDWAVANGYREQGANPGEFKFMGLPKARVLIEKRKVAQGIDPEDGHEGFEDFRRMRAFTKELRRREGMSARAFEAKILTASRAKPILRMTWEMIDRENGVINIPAGLMKTRKPFRFPVTRQLGELLDRVATETPEANRQPHHFVFPGPRAAMTSDTLKRLLERIGMMRDDGRLPKPHGLARKNFGEWADEMEEDDLLVERCLQHELKGIRKTYRKSNDVLEPRRRLMQRYADWLDEEV